MMKPTCLSLSSLVLLHSTHQFKLCLFKILLATFGLSHGVKTWSKIGLIILEIKSFFKPLSVRRIRSGESCRALSHLWAEMPRFWCVSGWWAVLRRPCPGVLFDSFEKWRDCTESPESICSLTSNKTFRTKNGAAPCWPEETGSLPTCLY